MAGNEIDTHATLNDLKTPRANDGGREAVLIGFLTFLGLIVFFSTATVSWFSSIIRSLICVLVPLSAAFTTWKLIEMRQTRRVSQESEQQRTENYERAEKQIAEARARGDFDRWNKDK